MRYEIQYEFHAIASNDPEITENYTKITTKWFHFFKWMNALFFFPMAV